MTGITSYGAYIPRLRLQRNAIGQANAWFAPGSAKAKGERGMANWDEDAVTMAVEAARDCLPAADAIADRAFVDGAYFASTTMPFADRQNAGIVAPRAQPAGRHFVVRHRVVAARRHLGHDRGARCGGGWPPQGAAGRGRREAQGPRRLPAGIVEWRCRRGVHLRHGKRHRQIPRQPFADDRFRRPFPRRRRRVRLQLGRALDPRRGLHQDGAHRGGRRCSKRRVSPQPTSPISSCRARLRSSIPPSPSAAASRPTRCATISR